MSTRDVEIARHTVSWSVDAGLDQRGRDRLERLALGLGGDILENALTVSWGAAAELCIRRVDAPPTQVDWSWNDDELLAAWAATVGTAVSKAVGTPEVIRFASRFHATVDMVVSQLAGDRTREWAWTLMELTSETIASQDAVRLAVQRTMDDEPGLVVHLIADVARHDLLPRLADWCGSALLSESAEAAWAAAGGPTSPVGSERTRRTEPSRTPNADRNSAIMRLLGTVRDRSAIWHARTSIPTTLDPSDATTGQLHDPTLPDAGMRLALARLAILETEPGLVPGASAAEVVAHLAFQSSWWVDRDGAVKKPDGDRHSTPVVQADPSTTDPPLVGSSAGDEAPTPEALPPDVPSAGGSSSWGGLMFLLSLLDEDGFAPRVAADPGRYGVALRAALGVLAVELLARAAPDTRPDENDPAVLAFCGLDTEEPYPGSDAGTDWVGPEVARLMHKIRTRLTPDRSGHSEQALLLGVMRRRALITVDPGWIDVELDINDVDVDVRAAGLDLDPGYLAWLGAVVRFRYV